MMKITRYSGILCLALGMSLMFTPHANAKRKCGLASWYSMGKRTANGERYRPNGLSVAHRYLRFGTRIKVTNMRNGRSLTLRVNARGPFIRRRIVDVSKGAARKLGFLSRGITKVCITY